MGLCVWSSERVGTRSDFVDPALYLAFQYSWYTAKKKHFVYRSLRGAYIVAVHDAAIVYLSGNYSFPVD
jgi:hypothetical protein